MAKKQLHPAAPVANLDHRHTPLERLVEENLRSILIAGAVILVAAIGYLVFSYLQESKASDEAIAFTRAKTIDEYRQMISKYPGSPAAGNAQLMIAKLLKKEQDGKQEAKGELRTFLETYKDHPQRDQALFMLAGILIEEKNTAEAAPYLDTLIQEIPDSPLAGYAKLYKGDFAYAADKREEAEQLYNSVLTSYSGTPAELATQRLDLAKIDKPVPVEPRPEPKPEGPAAGNDLYNIPEIIRRPEEPVVPTEGGGEVPSTGDGDAK